MGLVGLVGLVSVSEGASTCVGASVAAPTAKEDKDWGGATIWIGVVRGEACDRGGESAGALAGFAVGCGEGGCEFEAGSASLDAGAATLDFPKTMKDGVASVGRAAMVTGGNAGDEGLVSGAGSGAGLAMDLALRFDAGFESGFETDFASDLTSALASDLTAEIMIGVAFRRNILRQILRFGLELTMRVSAGWELAFAPTLVSILVSSILVSSILASKLFAPTTGFDSVVVATGAD